MTTPTPCTHDPILKMMGDVLTLPNGHSCFACAWAARERDLAAARSALELSTEACERDFAARVKAEARAEANARVLRELVKWNDDTPMSYKETRKWYERIVERARAAIAEGKKPAHDEDREAMQRRERAYERGAPQDHQADAERRAEHRAAGDQ